MKSKFVILSMLVCILACLSTSQSFAGDKDAAQAKLEAKAKITKAQAKKIALAKVPKGKIKESELEEEKGKLVWSFDIATPGDKDITEVQVDAMTGEVVSVEKETPEDQKKEKGEKEDKEAADKK